MAPLVGLSSPGAFTLLMASAFAAVVAAKLKTLWIAVVAGLLLGVLGGALDAIVPSDSVWASGLTSSLPILVMAVFILIYPRQRSAGESASVGGPLDHAIATAETAGPTVGGLETGKTPSGFRWPVPMFALALPLVIVGALVLLGGIWVGVVGLGLVYGVIFLSYTVLTGEGGIISLCQITFAGIGGVMAAQFADAHHWPLALSILAGALVAVPFGLVIGVLSLSLGDVYLALVTLTFGVLMDNLVFSLNVFSQYGTGVVISRPEFASSDRAFALLADSLLRRRTVRRQPPTINDRPRCRGRARERRWRTIDRRQGSPYQDLAHRHVHVHRWDWRSLPGHVSKQRGSGVLRHAHRTGMAGCGRHLRSPLHRWSAIGRPEPRSHAGYLRQLRPARLGPGSNCALRIGCRCPRPSSNGSGRTPWPTTEMGDVDPAEPVAQSCLET